MEHSEFAIGQEFWCSDRLWRCTDVGRRVIVAMRIDEVTARTLTVVTKVTAARTLTGAQAEAEGWFDGPPYAVEEHVFNEYYLEACTLTREEQ